MGMRMCGHIDIYVDLEAVRAGVKPALLVEGAHAPGNAWAAALAELGADWVSKVPTGVDPLGILAETLALL